jgi:hypothetical protein
MGRRKKYNRQDGNTMYIMRDNSKEPCIDTYKLLILQLLLAKSPFSRWARPQCGAQMFSPPAPSDAFLFKPSRKQPPETHWFFPESFRS